MVNLTKHEFWTNIHIHIHIHNNNKKLIAQMERIVKVDDVTTALNVTNNCCLIFQQTPLARGGFQTLLEMPIVWCTLQDNFVIINFIFNLKQKNKKKRLY